MWGAIIGGLSGFAGMSSGMNAAREQRKLTAMNVDLVKKTSAEEERRLGRDVAQSESMTSAISAASGVQVSGSREISIADTKRENMAQIDWLRKSNKQKAKTVQAGGDIKVGQLKTQALMSGLQGFSQIASSGLFGSGKT